MGDEAAALLDQADFEDWIDEDEEAREEGYRNS